MKKLRTSFVPKHNIVDKGNNKMLGMQFMNQILGFLNRTLDLSFIKLHVT